MSTLNYDVYKILTLEEAQELVLVLQGMEWETGRARTKEATGTVKKNQEITMGTNPTSKSILEGLMKKLSNHKDIVVDHSVKKIYSAKFNKYTPDNGGEYQRHGDAAVMGGTVRTDMAMTLWLSHPDTYEGGMLCVENSDGSYHTFKGDPGTCIIYPCHNPHWVTPVTKGERICMITWMESMYRDIEQRDLIRRFIRTLHKMEKDPELAFGDYFTTFACIHSKLTRMWGDYV